MKDSSHEAAGPAVNPRNLLPVLFLAALAALVIYLRLHFISLPLDNDEGVYAYIANFMNRHYLPYRDIFDHKPPGIYFIYKLAMNLFGSDAGGIRFFAALYTAAALIAVYFAAARLKDGRAKYAAALFFAACQGSVMLQGINANTETFLSLPLALAVFFAAKGEKENFRMLAMSGLMLAISSMIKESAAPAFILALVYMALKKYPVKKIACFITGFIVPFVIAALWLARFGILGDFIKCCVLFNFWYMASGLAIGARIEPRFLVEYGILIIAAVYAAFGSEDNRDGINMSFIILAGALAGIILQKGIWPHSYICACAPLCICAGLAANKLRAARAAALVALFLILSYALNWPYYFMNTLDVSKAQFNTPRFAESKLMAEKINSIKKPGQTLFVYFAQPEVYFLTGIRAPGRYLSMFDWNVLYDEAGVNAELKDVYYSKPDYMIIYKKSLFTFASMLPYYRPIVEGKELVLYVKIDNALKKPLLK
ncbi:MAG: glycosyltransferase family 39 protein [Candidatus Goldiibacteriota bacterium]|jgi:4-amino-4-deoxy-L-arabinose transferase-like glycosyltransferase